MEIEYEEVNFPSVEHAYQAAKCQDYTMRWNVAMQPTPGWAKIWGRKVTLRPDWESIKLQVMLDLVRIKFAVPELRAKLLATGDAELIEGNYWGDRFWGVCKGVGENHLGKILMQVREEIRNGT